MKLGIVTWYELNKDYVANVLCINKDKPQINCKGKCYLNKQIKKVDQGNHSDSKNIPQTNKKNETVEYLMVYSTHPAGPGLIADHITHRTPWEQPTGHEPLESIFRPPSTTYA